MELPHISLEALQMWLTQKKNYSINVSTAIDGI
jgi:hypothetical protein